MNLQVHGIFMRGSFHSSFICCVLHYCQDEKEGDENGSSAITQQGQGRAFIMEVHHHQHSNNENNTDFFPVEHPMEPTDEDRPVKCPMPESSVINNNDGGVHDKRHAESLRKRVEISEATVEGGRVATLDTEPRARGVRKRHHTLTHGGDLVMTPLIRMPTPPPLPSHQNIAIFEMLQQLDKFEP
ncbi:uncharacterized protein LOC107632098 isoform X1 [Arachis ipaensis]|uniref:uncharacterized protein LOC107632098 isoform X1 n=1 Tax=Arachis ipaensis TaxID=130454 RepID=UPI000A2B84D8|nr:uncharacterized protein LOC107632098 isoform X1 [Arachis ipaensis]XP_025639918.1 uncharacterized protein LOC112734703 isoform X1 [Arachis hypogaea]